MKKYLIFDLDWTLIKSMWESVNTVVNYLNENYGIEKECAKYYINSTAWKPLLNQVEYIFKWSWKEEWVDFKKVTNNLYTELEKLESWFFEWVAEKIKDLSESYKLYLTTWNSTKVAEKHLKEVWIYDMFEIVFGSDIILKWDPHINAFIKDSADKDFIKKTIYIWDWSQDRIISENFWIDFIHIWNEWKDKYEIESVKDIEEILKNFEK